MRSRNRLSGPQVAAHVLLAPLLALAIHAAWRTGYPNLLSLMGVYLVGAAALYELMARLAGRRATRLFARTGKSYAVLLGLAAVYIASDAYAIERAWTAYPAAARWFGFLFGAIVVLGCVLLVRRSQRTQEDEMFVAMPRFAATGAALFVILISLQLIAMAALLPWPALAVVYRIVFCVAAFWIGKLGVLLRVGGIAFWGLAFFWLGLMTVYLDLLWPFRATWPFLAGAIVLGGMLAAVLIRKGRRALRRASALD
ncbi:hypothetical protein [Iodidimonas sp. SYSU 1G8]|uniref:hypothetical protein n=1 Tax=Iodidimonas sp. SYSU 1G8 TaxID=3133967 RepID=UPI0031FEEB4E